MRFARAQSTLALARLLALTLAWVGYFTPWIWPVPAALRLSGYDLVEWLTFAQSVRDGTHPVTRLDMLWPLVGVSLLSALIVGQQFEPQWRKGRWGEMLRAVSAFGVRLLPALFAAYLILPGYPFILTAHSNPELRPQLLLGISTGAAAIAAAALACLRRRGAEWAIAAIAILSLAAALRAYGLARQPVADIFTRPTPVGYGLVLAVAGFSACAAVSLTRLRQDGRMPKIQTRV